jgi:spore maturation protein CgeB
MARRILCVGTGESFHLAASYRRAFSALGWRVSAFDLDAAVRRQARLGALGARFNDYVPVESWVRKANREFLLAALDVRPDFVLVVGHVKVRVGALAQLAASLPATRFAFVWPDTLLNLGRDELESLPLYDVVASYGKQSVPAFERLGARRVEWIPLAADPEFHAVEPLDDSTRARCAADVIFVGNHRPERERSVLALLDAGISVSVWGGDAWRRSSSAPARVDQYWQERELFGREFASLSSAAKICINLIDPTNYPAANMRFFENLLFGVVTVNTSCPEQEDVFRDGEHTVYARDDRALVAAVRRLLADEPLRRRIATAGQALVLAEHTYVHRARAIAASVGLSG